MANDIWYYHLYIYMLLLAQYEHLLIYFRFIKNQADEFEVFDLRKSRGFRKWNIWISDGYHALNCIE